MVRQRSAKPLFIGSIPIAASKNYNPYFQLALCSLLELLTRGAVQMYKTYRTVGKTMLRQFLPRLLRVLGDCQG